MKRAQCVIVQQIDFGFLMQFKFSKQILRAHDLRDQLSAGERSILFLAFN